MNRLILVGMLALLSGCRRDAADPSTADRAAEPPKATPKAAEPLKATLKAAEQPKPPAPKAAEQPKPEPAPVLVGVAELWEAHRTDAVAALRKYGKRPLIEFRADAIQPFTRGKVRAIQKEAGGIEHKFLFNEADAANLKAGETFKARGVVDFAGQFGLEIDG